MTRESKIDSPSSVTRQGILPSGLAETVSAFGSSGVPEPGTSSTSSIWPVRCSVTMTLRTKGERGEW